MSNKKSSRKKAPKSALLIFDDKLESFCERTKKMPQPMRMTISLVGTFATIGLLFYGAFQQNVFIICPSAALIMLWQLLQVWMFGSIFKVDDQEND